MPENNNVELRSEEVQEIMNRVPPAILRCGIIVIAVAVAILIGIASFITIPVTESCKVVITNTGCPPQAVIYITPSALPTVLSGSTTATLSSPLISADPVVATISAVRTDTLVGGAYPAILSLPPLIAIPRRPQLIEATADVTVSSKTLFTHLRSF
jgi:hypothetical protein